MVHGDGSTYQRASDGRWIAAIDAGFHPNGKRRRVHVTSPGCLPKCPKKCPHRAKIDRKLRDKRAEITKASGNVASGAMLRKTVKGWADEWLVIRQTKVRPKTYDVDRAALRWIIGAVGGKRLVDLTPRDVRTIIGRQRSAGLMPSTMQRNHRAFVKLLRDAVHEGYAVPANVLTEPGPESAENDRQALESVQAVAVMHHAADLPHGSRYFVAFYQGLRQGEALGLTWDAIDFESNMIVIEWQLQPLPYLDKKDRSKGFRVPDGYAVRHLEGRFHLVRPKTKKGYRAIPMVPEVRQALLDLRSLGRETVGNLVWTRENGWPIDKADDAAEFRRLQDAAKVRHPDGRHYYGHEMRNTTATLLLEADIDPVTITAIMGHSSWVVSAGYMKAREPRLRAAMEQIAEALRPRELT